jgi:hypothetical protein
MPQQRPLRIAVKRVLEKGYRTADIAAAGDTVTGTHEMGEACRRGNPAVINREIDLSILNITEY